MSVFSGTIGAITQSNAANRATNAQEKAEQDSIAFQREMYQTARGDFMPYMEVGKNALYDIYGYTPTEQTTKELIPGTGQYVRKANTEDSQYPSAWDYMMGTRYNQPPNGPATTYYDEWVEPQYRDVTKQVYTKTGAGIDPTGGAEKYLTQLENFKPTFDENDPIYVWRQEQAEKAVNKILASRGLYDSRVGINALADQNRALTAEESDKQYTRQYGKLTDMINTSMNVGKTKYGAAYDLARMGAGAASGGASSALATGTGVASTTNALGNALAQGIYNQGTIGANYISGIQSTPYNALATYNMANKLWGGLGAANTATAAAQAPTAYSEAMYLV